MKKTVLFLALVLSLSFTACAKPPAFAYKPLTGVNAIFDEEIGYNSEDAAVMQIDDYTRYVYYTANAERYGDRANRICVRKGVYNGEKYVYGPASEVLQTSQSGWDGKNVYAPSVVKGDFTYDGKMYRYLMAYAGCGSDTYQENSQIGLALGDTPDGAFVKVGSSPVVAYDGDTWGGASQGIAHPSLIGYDLKNKILLFYSFYSPMGADAELMLELDLGADMKTLPAFDAFDGIVLNDSGLVDTVAAPTFLGGDFAYDEATDTLYAVRDRDAVATQKPYCHTALQIVKGSLQQAVYRIPAVGSDGDVWTAVNKKVEASDTGTVNEANRRHGYDRIYSAGIVRDAFGRTVEQDKLEIVYTSAATAVATPDYAYTSMLHSFIQLL